MSHISSAKIAILATDGFEKSELFEPKAKLEDAGAGVTIVSLQPGEIKSWDQQNWGETVEVDITLSDANANRYDALVLPGGQINPDVLRADESAVAFVREFSRSGKPVAAICHAPWLLAEADVLRDRKATSYHSIKTDIKNAGAHWEDNAVVIDDNLITSREPGDLETFCTALIEEIEKRSLKRAS